MTVLLMVKAYVNEHEGQIYGQMMRCSWIIPFLFDYLSNRIISEVKKIETRTIRIYFDFAYWEVNLFFRIKQSQQTLQFVM